MRHSKDKKKNPDLFHEVSQASGTDQDHSKKLGRYGAAKQHQASVAEYLLNHEPLLIKEYDALQDCGSWLIFRHWYTVGQYRLIAGCSCKKHLLCGLCALRRAARLVKEYELKIRQVLEEHPEYVPVLITRTIKNGSDLGERYEHLTSAHRKMIHKRRNALSSKTARGKKSVLRFVHGSAGSYEFKKGEGSGEWHPHAHEIALLDSRFEFTDLIRKEKDVSVPLEFESQLSKEWLSTTGDSWIVDVRRIDAKDEKSFVKAICEAFKYALKFNSLEIPDQVYAYKVLRGRRLTYSYGCLWGVKISDESVDTIEEELELLPYVDLVYRYASGQYIQSEVVDLGKIEKKTSTLEQKRKSKARRMLGHVTVQGFDKQYIKEWIDKSNIKPSVLSEVPF